VKGEGNTLQLQKPEHDENKAQKHIYTDTEQLTRPAASGSFASQIQALAGTSQLSANRTCTMIILWGLKFIYHSF
jgi:hypothetical protein